MSNAARSLRARANEIREFRKKEMRTHGAAIRRALIASAKRSTGGDGAFSGLGNRPKLGASVRIEQGARTTTVTIKPSPKASAGPWRWIEDGTAPGWRAKRTSARAQDIRSRRAVSRRVAATQRGSSYFHPGTRSSQGDRAWSRPSEVELIKARKAIRSNFRQLMRGN